MSLSSYGHLSAPSSDPGYYVAPKSSLRRLIWAQTRQSWRLLITEFLWPITSSIIRPWWPFSTKLRVKMNHRNSNSMGLCYLITELLRPSTSCIIRPWLLAPKVFKKNHSINCNIIRLSFIWYPKWTRICTQAAILY